jgi:hypothetical protein
MYSLPKDTDLSFLIKKQLHQVCIGSNDLILNFDGGEVRISIISECIFHDNSGEAILIDRYPANASVVCQLLGSTVMKQMRARGGKALLLEFSNGQSLEIIDDSDQYESFQIKHGDRLIVV